jgi:hypothetical protein
MLLSSYTAQKQNRYRVENTPEKKYTQKNTPEIHPARKYTQKYTPRVGKYMQFFVLRAAAHLYTAYRRQRKVRRAECCCGGSVWLCLMLHTKSAKTQPVATGTTMTLSTKLSRELGADLRSCFEQLDKILALLRRYHCVLLV